MHASFKQSRRAGGPTLLTIALAASLAACSGGGDPAAPGATSPTSASVSGSAAIGAVDGRKGVLAGAKACLDLDGNGACGADEPQVTTAADGGFVIAAPGSAAAAGLVVEVPASATADGVAVGTAFTLRAPAGSASVTPLSTLVVAELDSAGGSAAEAAERLRQRAALAASPLAALAEGDAARLAAQLRRLTALQAEALAGSSLPAADIAREVARVQAAALADIAQAVRDGAGDDTLRAIAARIGPDAAQVAAAGRMFALAEPVLPDPPVASGQVTALRYTDPDNWFVRSLQGSAADNVPDASGYVRYHEVYAQSSKVAAMPVGTVQRWAGNSAQSFASDLHWNGSAWVACGLTDRFASRVRDSAGRSDYNFCNGRETGNSIRRVEDISGLDMESVFRDRIRTFPGGSAGVTYASWGPSDLAVLRGRSFPPASYLSYQTNVVSATAVTFSPLSTSRVTLYPAGVAAGGDTRSAPGIDCNNPTLTALSAVVPATTLEQMIGRLGGRPCVYAQEGVAPNLSLNPNEWWTQSTVSLGSAGNDLARPAGTGTFYSTGTFYRVSFTVGGRARFFRCYSPAGPTGGRQHRNCQLAGLGTWRIESLGDARVLSFSTLPASIQRVGFNRVFVERGGAVYLGTRLPVGGASTQLRLNLTAANAVFDVLGMPPIRPVTQPGTATGARAAVLATAQGVFGSADDTSALLFRFGADGRFLMAQAKPYEAVTREQSGGELGWFDLDPASGRASTLLEVDSNLTSGTSHPRADDPSLSISATAITDSAGSSLPRLRDDRATDPRSLVGLWAVNSPTDLSAAHMAFFANGRALYLTQQTPTECPDGGSLSECPPGVEYASYTWDPATGRAVLNLLDGETRLSGGQRLLHYDTNGCDGLFRTCPTAVASERESRSATIVLTLAPDGLSFTSIRLGVTLTAYRVQTRGIGAVAITDDTYIRAEFPADNYGNDPLVTAYRGPGGDADAAVALYKVPLERIPATATRVFLNLNVFACFVRDVTARFEVYRVTSDWQESTVTWATRPGIDGSVPWASQTFPSSTVGFRRFDITALVQAWRDGTHPNHGVAIDRLLAGTETDCSFVSHETRSGPALPITTGRAPFLSFE